MAITIERQGQRVYLVGDTYAIKDRIKSVGGHWDSDRRAWWVGAKKEADVTALLSQFDPAPSAGMQLGTPEGIVADKMEDDGRPEEAEKVRAAADAPKPKQDPDDIRLTGKGEYRGRMYYLGGRTRDGARIRCLTMPDPKGDYLDFWADASAVKVVREYMPRQVWDGRRYSGRTRTQYTTLGSIASFIARERRNRADGGAVCADCGKSGDLVTDLEDGLQKHRHCCDIEP